MSGVEAFLRAFHDARPGISSRAFGGMAVSAHGTSHASSYHLLADALRPLPADAAVLDVGCGDGFLLSVLAQHGAATTTLCGIDLSPAELRHAAQRLGPRASLCRGRAQALPYPDCAFSHVVSHMALMLMDDADAVLREIRRVVLPGGMLAAVVGARSPQCPELDAFSAIYARYPRRPEYADLRFGDRRMRSAQGLCELLQHGFAGVTVSDCSGSVRLSLLQMWDWLLDMYDLHLLDEGSRNQIREEYLRAIVPLAGADGAIDHAVAMRVVVATAA